MLFRSKFSQAELEKIDIVSKAIVNKILHTPTTSMKETNGWKDFDSRTLNSFVKHLFGLEKKNAQ